MTSSAAKRPTDPQAHTLLLNHIDAWAVAIIMATIALVVHDALNLASAVLVAAIGIGYWIAFAVNDYFDAPHDAVDPEKGASNYFVRDAASRRTRLVLAILVTLALALIPLFASYGWRGVVVVAVGLLIMWAYSAPPLRLKSRPGIDLVVHCCFVETFPFVAVLFLLGLEWTSLDLFLLIVAALGSFSAQVEQQLRDYHVDALTSDTFVLRVGRRRAYRLLVVATLLLAGVAVAAFAWDIVPLALVPFGLVAAPSLVHRLIRGPQAPPSQTIMRAIVVAALVYLAIFVVVA